MSASKPDQRNLSDDQLRFNASHPSELYFWSVYGRHLALYHRVLPKPSQRRVPISESKVLHPFRQFVLKRLCELASHGCLDLLVIDFGIMNQLINQTCKNVLRAYLAVVLCVRYILYNIKSDSQALDHTSLLASYSCKISPRNGILDWRGMQIHCDSWTKAESMGETARYLRNWPRSVYSRYRAHSVSLSYDDTLLSSSSSHAFLSSDCKAARPDRLSRGFPMTFDASPQFT